MCLLLTCLPAGDSLSPNRGYGDISTWSSLAKPGYPSQQCYISQLLLFLQTLSQITIFQPSFKPSEKPYWRAVTAKCTQYMLGAEPGQGREKASLYILPSTFCDKPLQRHIKVCALESRRCAELGSVLNAADITQREARIS